MFSPTCYLVLAMNTIYIAQVSYNITDMCEGRAVGTLIRDITLRMTENTETCARQALADWLVSANVAWANLSSFRSYRVLKTVKA